MTAAAQPLRFLAVLIGGWACLRLVTWVPAWTVQEPPAAPAVPSPAASLAMAPSVATAQGPPLAFEVGSRSLPLELGRVVGSPLAIPAFTAAPSALAMREAPATHNALPLLPTFTGVRESDRYRLDATELAPALRTAARPPGRLSLSGWLYLRDEGRPALAPGSVLGGSQAGLRATWRVNADATRPLALSARLYAPVERPQGSEAAVGIDWRPFARVPVHLMAERRERLGRDGRSDFAVTVYGGGSVALASGRARLDTYAQAGLVGTSAPDAFADGAATIVAPGGRLEVGAGAWGGAQPGAARLDIGPHAAFRLPTGNEDVRISVQWRLRVAGDARPGSGLALTLSAGF